MASKYIKHGSFRDHVAAIKPLLSGKSLSTSPRLIVLYGTSDLLLNETARVLREQAVACHAATTNLEATAINEATLTAMTQQASLFEPASFYLVRRSEAAKSLAKILGSLGDVEFSSNHLCFVYQGDSIAAALKTALTKLKAVFVPCFVPWPNEIPQVIGSLAEQIGLKLLPEAVPLLISANGDDLAKNHNELRRLHCLFGSNAGPLGAAEISPHLGLLRENESVQLERLLIQKQWAKAYALSANLIARGEKALPLVALLANHCRTVLKLTAANERGVSPQALATAANVPPFVVKTYQPYLSRMTNPLPYEKALVLCQEADHLLKSERFSEDLVVTRIIDAIASS
ncbi:MAG: DNA polymerase III subunit delta [Proteobacteria bacterium]|nr:DNA polymerase III subunit delta [Pseudomonadota bacterium]